MHLDPEPSWQVAGVAQLLSKNLDRTDIIFLKICILEKSFEE